MQFLAGLTAIGVPEGYVSGGALSGSATYQGQNFSTLGVTPGTYSWTLGNGDTVSLAIGAASAAVPGPSTLALLASGAACLALRRWRP